MSANEEKAAERHTLALMLSSVGLFSVNTLMVRAISIHFPAADGWLASLFRGVFGMAVVFALHGRRRGLRMDRLFASRLVATRGIVGALTIVILYVTIVQLGAARAVILHLTYPVFGSIIAAVWLKENLGRAAIIWMIIGLCGLAVFLGGDGKLLHPSPYDLLALAGAAASGWVIVIIRRLRHEEHPLTIFASQALYSVIIAGPAALKLPQIPLMASAGLAAAAAIVAIAQLQMTRAYQSMPVAKGSSIQMLLPIFTGVGGFFLMGETFQTREILGAAVTLIATWRVVANR